jgi:hypothetical protein
MRISQVRGSYAFDLSNLTYTYCTVRVRVRARVGTYIYIIYIYYTGIEYEYTTQKILNGIISCEVKSGVGIALAHSYAGINM